MPGLPCPRNLSTTSLCPRDCSFGAGVSGSRIDFGMHARFPDREHAPFPENLASMLPVIIMK